MVLVKPLCTGIGVVGELCGGILRVKPRGRGPELSIGLTETGSRGRASSRSVEPGFGPSPGSGIRYTMVGFPGGIPGPSDQAIKYLPRFLRLGVADESKPKPR